MDNFTFFTLENKTGFDFVAKSKFVFCTSCEGSLPRELSRALDRRTYLEYTVWP
jgi:hypothetical protein